MCRSVSRLDSALALDTPVRLVCTEGKPPQLLAELALHDLDVAAQVLTLALCA
jgi:hypothetical protein